MGMDNQEPMESDMVDDAPEPDIDEGVGETGDGTETRQKITTKFLTKYERGTYSAIHFTHFIKHRLCYRRFLPVFNFPIFLTVGIVYSCCCASIVRFLRL